MTTIYSITADGQERYDSVRPELVAKTIKILQRKGALNIKVVPTTQLDGQFDKLIRD